MPDQRLSIYNASAGSGKTYQIAKNFLIKILQSPDFFYTSRLIGLTFTNKAANEMKKRILDILTEAAAGKENPMMKEVAVELKNTLEKQSGKTLNEQEVKQILRKRSERRLKEILHQYDDFNLQTIDKLSYKIIRTFAREMDLPYDVNIIIEHKEIIKELIDEIISDLKPGDVLMQNLVQLALENVENEKSWDIQKNLLQITALIFDENHRNEIDYLKTKEREDIIRLKNSLQKKVSEIRKQYLDIGRQGLKIIKESGESFGAKGLFGKMATISEHNKIEFSNGILKKMDKQELLSQSTLKKKYKDSLGSIKEAQERMLALLNKAYDFHERNYEDYILYKGILNEINSLIILHALLKKIEDYKEQTHSIFISDFNALIQKQILQHIGDETPYIYMRLGEKFIHYFLDEFQDTSELQWLNMIPLIKEALSKDFSVKIDEEYPGTSMIVGDAKQSIYRFRNGKPEIFIDLSNEELQNQIGNPFYQVTGKKVHQLDENWRSDGKIIAFNNEFFSRFKDLLIEPKYKRVYEHVKQKVPEIREKVKGRGYIEISFEEKLSNKDDSGVLAEKIHKIIMDALARGYRYEDIAFLYDSHESSHSIADYLSKKNIPFLAEKALKLGQSLKVNAIMHFLKYLYFQKTEPLFESLYFLFDYHKINGADVYMEEILERPGVENVIQVLEKAGFPVDIDLLYGLNLFDLVVYLIDKLHLNKDSIEENYIQTLLDDIYQFTTERKTGVIAYLMHWNRMKDEINVQAAEKKGAVQFMTVHGAKGLEFPIVIYLGKGKIFDNANGKDHDQIVWIKTDPGKFEGFETVPVKLKFLENITNYKEIYQSEVAKKMFDNYNRLYVAHTRAKSELYIFTQKPALKNADPAHFKTMYATYVFETKGVKPGVGDCFSYGEKTSPPEREKQEENLKLKGDLKSLHYWNEDPDKQPLKLRTKNFELWQEAKKAAIQYGLQMHEIMAQITTFKDWENNKEKYLSVIPAEERQEIEMQIEKIIYHPELKKYFTEEYRILNERALLIPEDGKSFKLRRPDRILLKNKTAVVMDYKTGEPGEKHKKQLDEYAKLIEATGYDIEEKILIYLGKQPELIFL